MVYILIFISFLFEVFITNIVNINSFLIPLFVITSFTILYPYFLNKKINFIVTCVVSGFLYDIACTNSMFINTICFGFCGGLIIFFYNYIKYSIYSSNLINIVNIIFYRFISYLLLIIVDYMSFNKLTLLEGIYNSILINVVYGIIIYSFADVISKLFNIKRD